MDKKYNLIAGILHYLTSIIYLGIAFSEDSLPCAIGFVFWILAGFFQIDTYRNKKRRSNCNFGYFDTDMLNKAYGILGGVF